MKITYPDTMTYNINEQDTGVLTTGGTMPGKGPWMIHPDTGELVEINPEQAYFWTPEWFEGEREADRNLQEGYFETFDSVEEMMREPLPNEPPHYYAMDVAKFLLHYSDSDESGDGMTNNRLQKLLYYCQGFHLAITGFPLFNARIEAWSGPVVPDVWNVFKVCGSNPIQTYSTLHDWENPLSDAAKEVIADVYEVYGIFTNNHLLTLVRKEWPFAMATHKEVIKHSDLRTYFKTQLIDEVETTEG